MKDESAAITNNNRHNMTRAQELIDSSGLYRPNCDMCSLSQAKVQRSQSTQSEEMNINISGLAAHSQCISAPTTHQTPTAVNSFQCKIPLYCTILPSTKNSATHSPPRRRKLIYIQHSLSTSHLPIPSPKFFLLALSSFLILLSSMTSNVIAQSIDDDGNIKYLRTSSSAKSKKHNSSHSKPLDDDYESNIPLPSAIGASLMGIMKDTEEGERAHPNVFAFAGTNEAIWKFADLEKKDNGNAEIEVAEETAAAGGIRASDDVIIHKSSNVFAYAGTNQAMLSLVKGEGEREEDGLGGELGKDSLLLRSDGHNDENESNDVRLFAYSGISQAMKNTIKTEQHEDGPAETAGRSRSLLLKEHTNDVVPDEPDDDNESHDSRLFAFAGISQAMKNFIKTEEDQDAPVETAVGSKTLLLKEETNDVAKSGRLFAFAGINQAMKNLARAVKQEDDSSDADTLLLSTVEDAHDGRLFAHSGINQAMKNLAQAQNQGSESSEMASNTLLLTTDGQENDELPSRPFAFAGTNQAMLNLAMTEGQERTLLLTDESRSSMSWGFDSEAEEEADVGSSLHALKSSRHTSPMMERTNSDLDNGRYFVGLEVRDVQTHQQILIDYDTIKEGTRKPLRVKYALATGAGTSNANELLLLEQLMETSFSAAADMWSEALTVTSVPNKIYPTVESCGAAAVPALDRENGIEDADIMIYVSSDNTFCGGALMHSAVCDFDQHTRPLVGNINICTKDLLQKTQGMPSLHDFTTREYSSYLTTETGRILGASTSLFRYYMDPQTMSRYGSTEKSLTCADGKEEILEVPNIIFEDVQDGNRFYEIRTPRVTEIIRNHFDCMILTGARLEQGIDSIGCFGGFLDDHLFYSEEMTRFETKSMKGPTISPLTLALLEDSSWYTANYKSSTETSFGRGAGCQFAHSGCVFDELNSELDSGSSAFHCTEIGEMGCDASHSYKAKCDFLDSVAQQSDGTTSYCPMHTREAISCTDSSAFMATGGEYFGKSSKCFHTDKGEPMCLRGECNEANNSIDVYYEGQMFSCQKDDQIIDTKNGLQIKCPKIAVVCPSLSCPSNCSGRGVCDRDREGKRSCICDDPFDSSPGCYRGEYQLDEL